MQDYTYQHQSVSPKRIVCWRTETVLLSICDLWGNSLHFPLSFCIVSCEWRSNLLSMNKHTFDFWFISSISFVFFLSVAILTICSSSNKTEPLFHVLCVSMSSSAASSSSSLVVQFRSAARSGMAIELDPVLMKNISINKWFPIPNRLIIIPDVASHMSLLSSLSH